MIYNAIKKVLLFPFFSPIIRHGIIGLNRKNRDLLYAAKDNIEKQNNDINQKRWFDPTHP